MKAQQLRSAVLQLAMQGKLVPQNPEDEPASVLLDIIKAEKEQLIKQGKVRKEKPLPEITNEDKPFEIPYNWEWVRLKEIGILSSGRTPKENELIDRGKIPYFKVSDMNTTGNKKYMVNVINYLVQSYKGKIFPKNSIIFPKNGGAVFTNKKRILTVESLVDLNTGVYTPNENMFFDYSYYLFLSIDFKKYSKGTALPTIDSEILNSLYFPLPPLAEQKRIVAKIEEIIPKIDEYEQMEKELSLLEKSFPENLRKSILQYAIEGNLVQKDLNDESVGVLLENIKVEKVRLIKEGKIKKNKEALLEIKAEEKPFEIPEGWAWVRVGEIFEVGTGMTPLKSESKYYDNGTVPWITSSATSSEYINHSETYITDFALRHTTLKVYGKGTLIMAMYGQGKTRGQISQLNIDATINQACSALESIYKNEHFISYVKLFFKYNYDNSRKGAEGSAQPNLNLTKVKMTVIPLPPLAEQQRIVARVDKLLLLCDVLRDEKTLNKHMPVSKANNVIELKPQLAQQDKEHAEKFDMVARAESISPETQAKMAERIKLLRAKK